MIILYVCFYTRITSSHHCYLTSHHLNIRTLLQLRYIHTVLVRTFLEVLYRGEALDIVLLAYMKRR